RGVLERTHEVDKARDVLPDLVGGADPDAALLDLILEIRLAHLAHRLVVVAIVLGLNLALGPVARRFVHDAEVLIVGIPRYVAGTLAALVTEQVERDHDLAVARMTALAPDLAIARDQ